MLAVAGGKGGVGKTTTAILVGRALARRPGVDPVVVDADADAPDLAVAAGLPPGDALTGLAGGAPLSAATDRDPRAPDLRVAPAAAGTPPATVAAALAHLRARPRPVVVDCPPGAGSAAALPLRAADAALLVSSGSPASLADAAKTARMARALETAVVGCLLTGEVGTDDAGAGPIGSATDDGVPEVPVDCVPVLSRLPRTVSPLADDAAELSVERDVVPEAARTFNFT